MPLQSYAPQNLVFGHGHNVRMDVLLAHYRKTREHGLIVHEPKPSHYTDEEVRDLIGSLDAADMTRLVKIAAFRSFGARMESDDILQKALVSVLQGGRKMPRHIDIIKFLDGVIQSVASTERRSISRHPENDLDEGVDMGRGYTIGQDPISWLLLNEQVANVKDIFQDDSVAQILLEGMIEGLDGKELRQLTELDTTEFSTKRRLIRRRLEKMKEDGNDNN